MGPKDERDMMQICAGLLALAVLGTASASVHAQQSNDCRACREFLQACLKAHSSAACNTDYAICMNHCRKKCSGTASS
jgi:hypothetical protein